MCCLFLLSYGLKSSSRRKVTEFKKYCAVITVDIYIWFCIDNRVITKVIVTHYF